VVATVAGDRKLRQSRWVDGSRDCFRPNATRADGLRATVADPTLRALVAELRERGVVTSSGSVWRETHGQVRSLGSG
jgi:hypothetical protein